MCFTVLLADFGCVPCRLMLGGFRSLSWGTRAAPSVAISAPSSDEILNESSFRLEQTSEDNPNDNHPTSRRLRQAQTSSQRNVEHMEHTAAASLAVTVSHSHTGLRSASKHAMKPMLLLPSTRKLSSLKLEILQSAWQNMILPEVIFLA